MNISREDVAALKRRLQDRQEERRAEADIDKAISMVNRHREARRQGAGQGSGIQLVINSSKYMRDFIGEYPPDFKISADCCTYCKKNVAHQIQKGYDMVITGERRDEGGMRSVPRKDNTSLCFTETSSGQYRLRPLYYVSDADKAWYKEYYGLRYSDAYEVYGLTRTGCCGCPISYKAIADLELIRPYEPNLVKAAWNIFGKSYEYRQKYNAYKAERMEREKTAKKKAASGE